MIDDDLLELQIPPEAEFVGTARLFLAAAGRHFELSEESVADAKVAVSEVCAGAIESPRQPEHLKIAIRPGLEALEVEVVPVGTGIEADPPPPVPDTGAASFEHIMREPLVHALFPDAAYEPAEHSLRLSLPWELPEEPQEP
ncbi:MAG TPA: ATP-binding protein [Actinomycetota bacterium]|nr:ATP-binding protein [Actinomycetota bacterium]